MVKSLVVKDCFVGTAEQGWTVSRMDDKTFKDYYEIERLKYCMGVVADWLNEHREYEIVEGEDRGIRVFTIQTKHSPTIAELKTIFPFFCYEPNCGAMVGGEQNE